MVRSWHKRFRLFHIILLFALSSQHGWSQKTTVSGKITGKTSGEPVPYVNIAVRGTFHGTMSDLNGNYHLSVPDSVCKIEVSAVGYIKQVLPVRQREVNHLDIHLTEDVIALDEIEVRPGENPANILIRKVISAKDANNPARLPSWKCRLYSKTEVDIKNIQRSAATRKYLSQFDFVFNYIDSLELEGKTFLPVFFNETISDYYHDGTTKQDREVILANKASGMTTDMITQFTGKMYEGVNVYENYIMFTDIGLISPVNSLGLQFYRYYLHDSTLTEAGKIYEMSFQPKLQQEPAFKGKMWIEEGSFAITRIEMKLSGKANVNFINNFQYSAEFAKNGDHWVPRNEVMVVDIDVQKQFNSEKPGVIGRKTNFYEDFRFSDVSETVESLKERITVQGDAIHKDQEYWKVNRPVELQPRESNVYEMVDSVKNVPLYKSISEYVYMFYYGYRDLGRIELGPYYYLYSSNLVEGTRLRLGARTTYKFDQKIRLNGFGAYGFKDREWKYGGGFEYFFSKKPLEMISLQIQHDMEMLGKSSNAFSEGNIMTTLLSKELNSKLNMTDRVEFTVKHEWKAGLMNDLTISRVKLSPSPFVSFTGKDGKPVPSLQTGEIRLGLRYSPGEDVVIDDFERNIYEFYNPVLNVSITSGIKGFLGGDFNYTKVSASLYNKMLLYPVGFSTYLLQAGKIWGNVPFPFLKVHEGNETYAFDSNAFNLMDYQEFISDAYVSLFFEHHFQGFFLNKIPLFRKLKWREIAGVRLLKGTYNEERHNSLKLPGNMRGLGKAPYTEFSAGLENILKVIRVDAVWRFNYNGNKPERLGLLFSLQVTL